MSSNKQITIKRLQKQQLQLEKEPIPGVMVKRQGFLNFYFCIFGLDDPYKGGFYYGLLQLHQNYPFAAPKLFFYTKSGRFEVNMSICTSFTSYHQESWTSAWNVRSLLIATISFMTSQEPSYGCRSDSAVIRRKYAEVSLHDNLQIQKFRDLFVEEFKKRQIQIPQTRIKKEDKDEESSSQDKEDKEEEMNVNVENVVPGENIENQLLENPVNENDRRNRNNKLILIAIVALVIVIGGITWFIVKH